MNLRDAVPADFAAVLRLNHESVRFLSPLTPERLEWLHGEACYHRVVVDQDGQVLAFLLGFREGTGYDSVNYRWFARRYPRFFYIDRVVVSQSAQGCGLGKRLYEDVFEFAAAQGLERVTCEYDLEPPNAVSQRMHQRFGFREVGRQSVPYGDKTVSLQAVELQSSPCGR